MPDLDEIRRRHYLQAMGIEVWLRRETRESLPDASGDASHISADAGVGAPAHAAPASTSAAESALADLSRTVAACTLCALHRDRNRTVFGTGAIGARCMVIGEGPGAQEDKLGEPFVGRAGRLLDAMLAAIELPRGQVFITNIVKCRPPGNRDPKPEEVGSCAGYLRRQIELVEPRVILAVGRIAAQNLLAVTAPLGRLRGREHTYADAIPVVVTYHPAYLLRSPHEKGKAWVDLKRVRSLLG